MNSKWLIGIILVSGSIAFGLLASNIGTALPGKENSNLLAEVSLIDRSVAGDEDFAVQEKKAKETKPENIQPVTEAAIALPTPKESVPVPSVQFPGSDVLTPEELLRRSEAENTAASTTSEQAQPSASPSFGESIGSSGTNHVVISEIRLTGGTGKTTEDFIELYNPTNGPIDITGWKLKKRTQSGGESSIRVFPGSSVIAARGFFLWASSEEENYASGIGADVQSAVTIAVNTSVALQNKDGIVIDAVAWGTDLINPFTEGQAILAVLEPNQSYEREAFQGSCVSPVGNAELSGNGCDTNSNSYDFVVRQVSNPQRKASGTE